VPSFELAVRPDVLRYGARFRGRSET
jgi:hypothetical protein